MERRVAVVTGGARGIGRACCERLLGLGHTVVFFDVDVDAADAFVSSAQGADLHYLHCDVATFSSVQQASDAVLRQFGDITILVNNAGIQTHCLLVEMTEELWNQTIAVNLTGAFATCRCFAPGMIEGGFGRIVNIASMSARRGSASHTHYCASKAGLVGFTRALSMEIARYGVTVNAICPGIVDTDMVQETLAKKRDVWLAEMHVKRLGMPEDIANALEFLVKEESSWVSGQALDINGGILTP
jgi:NAD(P)-dependent dehydrogenase (short-subunit alcohol dehydrogenase family)